MNFTALMDRANKGPWIIAAYTTYGGCSAGGCDILEGETEIRADGDGGWECRECCDDDDD